MTHPKSKTMLNFKKAQSLLAKMTEMLEQDRYCVDVMQQNLAAIGLLKSAHLMLMENHLKTCFQSAMQTKNSKKKRQMTQEILRVTHLFNK